MTRPQPEAILQTLSDHEVDFIVIGGLAAITHGSRRMTRDIDIVVEPHGDNLSRLETALRARVRRSWSKAEPSSHSTRPTWGLWASARHYARVRRRDGLTLSAPPLARRPTPSCGPARRRDVWAVWP